MAITGDVVCLFLFFVLEFSRCLCVQLLGGTGNAPSLRIHYPAYIYFFRYFFLNVICLCRLTPKAIKYSLPFNVVTVAAVFVSITRVLIKDYTRPWFFIE